MPSRYGLAHIDISVLAIRRQFKSPGSTARGGRLTRIREEHGAQLAAELAHAFTVADAQKPTIEGIESPNGSYIEIELPPAAGPAKLERRTDGVRQGADLIDPNTKKQIVALFVPDDARPVLEQILKDYAEGPLTEKGRNPPNKGYVEQIDAIREARLRTFWTDDAAALPTDPQAEMWWEAWCWLDRFDGVRLAAARVGARVANEDRFLRFPETRVMPIYASRAAIELLLFATKGIIELRRATDTPAFFTAATREEQRAWVDELSGRIVWPGTDAPAVCLFDTGVNRAHPLIEPALAPTDLQSVNPDWGGDDHDVQFGHGTGMAGLALHGDLTPLLASTEQIALRHRLESVKFLPPAGFDPNDPNSYGAITQAAVARAEIEQPERPRTFCFAVSNLGVNGSRPSTWSAAIDQAASGSMAGDVGSNPTPKRLFVISVGNIPDTASLADMRTPEKFAVEDPAQAWNALSVGGYTDKITITEADLDGWRPMVPAGALSPYSRTSVAWPQGRTPYKPDLVLEAGNRAVSPGEREVVAGIDSLSVLTTGRNLDLRPLETFWATSAAAAQGARLTTAIMAEQPDLWPETVRALLVHSADWTPPMRQLIDSRPGKKDRYSLLRRFGYGVPDLERALKSAQNDLALIAQNEIQPFTKTDGPRFFDSHVYPLPWPAQQLEELQNTPVRLKVTLSYFVEPNPGATASVDPQRYQSFGLRFDLKRLRETRAAFLQRINKDEREDPNRKPPNTPDNNWWFGSQSISTGSLHCDVWEGPAVELAAINMLCVYPIIGWWRERAHLGKCDAKARYALVASISTPDANIDLHSRISAAVTPLVGVAIDDLI